MTRPLIVAHRALTPGAPENARSSLARARDAGADLAELDVRLSLDRRPMVIHDAFLGRTTTGHGPVRLWPSFALRRLRLHGGEAGEHPPSLRDILRVLPDGLQPALHLKDRGALGPVLRQIARHGTPGRTWLWLDDPVDVFTARRRLPELRCTLLRPAGWTATARQSYMLDAQRSGARGISVPWGVVSPELVALARQHHLIVFSRLEDVSAIADPVAIGLGGIVTDDPAAVVLALGPDEPAVPPA
jgi:glycerophosphoryl diester phosphodiesterase